MNPLKEQPNGSISQLTDKIRTYNAFMCDIPPNFPVRDDYLRGLSQADFCAAFISLQKIVMDMYAYIEQHPEAVGLAKVSKTGMKTVQYSQNIAGVKKLLYAIGFLGAFVNGALVAPMRNLMNFYMLTFADYGINPKTSLSSYYKEFDDEKQRNFFEKKHMQLLFDCFEKFGFVVTLDDKVTIRYPQNPHVLHVLNAFASLRVCRNRFRFEFAKFNHRVFAYDRDERMALHDLYSYVLLSNEKQQLFSTLHNVLNVDFSEYASCSNDVSVGCQYNYKNHLRIDQTPEGDLHLYLVFAKVRCLIKTAEYIERLPEVYRRRINIFSCDACRIKDGKCIANRQFGTTENGKQSILCVTRHYWQFPFTMEAIPYIVEAYHLGN